MTCRELNLILIKEFPELILQYNNEIEWQEGDDTGSHVVYGDVLLPYLKKMISSNNCNKLKQISIFMEKLLKLNDLYVEEVISFSIIEVLDIDEIEIFKKYMGKLQKYILSQIE